LSRLWRFISISSISLMSTCPRFSLSMLSLNVGLSSNPKRLRIQKTCRLRLVSLKIHFRSKCYSDQYFPAEWGSEYTFKSSWLGMLLSFILESSWWRFGKPTIRSLSNKYE
jgi:hypothetical protein